MATTCPKCTGTVRVGAPFPCTDAFGSIDNIKANCGIIGKAVPKDMLTPEDAFDVPPAPKLGDVIPFDPKTHSIIPPAYQSKPKLTGGSSDYYKLPQGAQELQDLIEHKGMSFGRGNIFKAVYRLGEKDQTTEVYDLEKIIWFAQRRLDEIKRRGPEFI